MICSFGKGKITFDGRETQIVSGAIHYFRILPEQWRDRLMKLKQCGFDTVETYIAWHLHEKREGEWDFSGRLDFVKFIQLAGELGLHVIVRPGPYICSECDLGGLPGWLLGKAGIRLRCDNAPFLNAEEAFFDRIFPLLAELQCHRNGPVVAFQLENEYGSFGRDKVYLRKLLGFYRKHGIDGQVFTSDGDLPYMLMNGTLPELPATVNHRADPVTAQRNLHAVRPDEISFTMELWVGRGWHWGEVPLHHDENEVAADMRAVMENGFSVNCYMFHGGTNFGFTSGANDGSYRPLLTSYEVDALLDEAGNPTRKYYAVQKVMEQFRPGSTSAPSVSAARAYGAAELTGYISLEDALERISLPHEAVHPEYMEHFGQSFGYILYRTRVGREMSGEYTLGGMRDRAVVLRDGRFMGECYRNDASQKVVIPVDKPDTVIDILVENMGRINFGPEMIDERKGLGRLALGASTVTGFEIFPLPMEDLSGLEFSPAFPDGVEPGFYRGFLEADTGADSWLRIPGGSRGMVWINGFNLGRYWNIGPQHTLYVPAPLLKKGRNEVIVFDLHGLFDRRVESVAAQELGPKTPMIQG